MIKKLYNYVMKLAAKKNAEWVVAAVAFMESIFFPIPVDALSVPVILSNRKKAFKVTALVVLFSIIGGTVSFFIGRFFFQSIGMDILEFLGLSGDFDKFAGYYVKYGIWIVFFAALTPFPYQAVTITSGFMGMNYWLFLFGSITARTIRFALEGVLLYKYGEKAKEFIEKHLGWLTIIAFVILAITVYLLKF